MERKKACLVVPRVAKRTFVMLNKFKGFIQKYWMSILISWICFWLWMAYYGDNTIVKLVVFPIISFFLVILFHLELERKNIKYLSINSNANRDVAGISHTNQKGKFYAL